MDGGGGGGQARQSHTPFTCRAERDEDWYFEEGIEVKQQSFNNTGLNTKFELDWQRRKDKEYMFVLK